MLSAAFARMCMERIPPGRYETEMNMLILGVRILPEIHTVPIRTLYFQDNSNTKFQPWLDSWLVMKLFVNYGAVSLASFLLDYLLFILLLWWPGMPYLQANMAARVLSAIFNFVAHKEYSFTSKGGFPRKAIKYITAVLFTLLLATILLYVAVDDMKISEYIAKPLVDIVVFVLNFFVMSRLVFVEKRMAHS